MSETHIVGESDSIVEILQDFLFLMCLFFTKKNINDINEKALIGLPALWSLAIFSHELERLDKKYGEIINKKHAKFLNECRQSFLKEVPSENSKKVADVIAQSGLNFDNYIFDLVVDIDSNSNILGINFGTHRFENILGDNFSIFEELANIPYDFAKMLCKSIGYDYEDFFNQFEKTLSEKLTEGYFHHGISKKSYASSKIFNTPLSKQDKIYILYRYSLINSILLLSEIPILKISTGDGVHLINTELSLMKLKAMIISIIGDKDMHDINSPLLAEIQQRLSALIPDQKFFPANRKCRNNIHYEKTKILSDSEIFLLKAYQDKYLIEILNIFNQYLHLDLGFNYKISLAIAKLIYWAEH